MGENLAAVADLSLAPRRPRVIVADDDSQVLALFADALRGFGYDVETAANGLELFQHLGLFEDESHWSWRFDLVVTDVRMPGLTGTEALEGVAMMGGLLPVILMTSFVDAHAKAAAATFGAAALLEKPVAISDLLDVVAAALGKHRA